MRRERLDRLTELAAELVRLKVDMIWQARDDATRPAKEATNTIPIVMWTRARSCRGRAS